MKWYNIDRWRQTMSNETKFLGNCEIDHTANPFSSLAVIVGKPPVKTELSHS